MTLLKKMIKSFRINIKIKQIRNKTKHVIYLTQCTMFQSGFTQVYIGMFTGVKYLLVLPHSVSGFLSTCSNYGLKFDVIPLIILKFI